MRKAFVVLGTLLALTATACGANGGGEAQDTDPDTATGATGGTTGPQAECADLTDEGPTFTITMAASRFEPRCFTASASQGITIVNEDPFDHTFTIEDTMIDVEIEGEDTFRGEAVSGVLAPGTYEVICRFHPLMTADITVVA